MYAELETGDQRLHEAYGSINNHYLNIDRIARM